MRYDENKAKFRLMRQDFESKLRSTGRDGVDDCIAALDDLGFFSAPASTHFHLAYDGGLLEHSINVCNVACSLREAMIQLDPTLQSALPVESVIIA